VPLLLVWIQLADEPAIHPHPAGAVTLKLPDSAPAPCALLVGFNA
jgi:hypothetical protein